MFGSPRTRAARKAIGPAMRQVAADLDRIPAALLAKMQPLLYQAEMELRRDLLAQLRKGGQDTFTTARMRASLMHVQRARETLDAAGAELGAGLRLLTPAVASLSLRALEREVAALSGQFGDMAAPNFETASVMLRERGPLFVRMDSSAARYSGVVGDRLRAELAVARLRGLSMSETAARLDTRMGPVFDFARFAAERVARTETMNAYNSVHQRGIADWAQTEDGVLQLWDATNDLRVCLVCRRLDGGTAPPGRLFPDGYFGPPAHPYCRCVVLPWKVEWFEAARAA